MSPLGKFFLAIVGIFSFDVRAKDFNFELDLAKCDDMKIGNVQDVYEQVECYLNLGDKIIDINYKNNALQVKKIWNNYVQFVMDMNFEVKNSKDSCNPSCGLYSQFDGAVKGAIEIKKMLENLAE